MRKCVVHFGSQPSGKTDGNGTSILMQPEYRSGEFCIEWTLLDNSTSEKFYNNIVSYEGWEVSLIFLILEFWKNFLVFLKVKLKKNIFPFKSYFKNCQI